MKTINEYITDTLVYESAGKYKMKITSGIRKAGVDQEVYDTCVDALVSFCVDNNIKLVGEPSLFWTKQNKTNTDLWGKTYTGSFGVQYDATNDSDVKDFEKTLKDLVKNYKTKSDTFDSFDEFQSLAVGDVNSSIEECDAKRQVVFEDPVEYGDALVLGFMITPIIIKDKQVERFGLDILISSKGLE